MPREKPIRATPRRAPGRRGGGATLLLGIVLAAAFAALWLYHRFGSPAAPAPATGLSGQPPAPASPRHPAPPHAAHQPEAATDAEAPPFGISEDAFESGARLYSSRCAACHGTPRHSAVAAHPTALQLWQPNRAAGGTGVSHQTPAEIHRSIAEGQPAAGMPSYRGVLTGTQVWQLSLLLRNAGEDLPDPVRHLLDAAKP